MELSQRALYIGGDRALVQLPTGEYLCVDTQAWESLAHILGWDIEDDVIRVFRCFLEPESVVLDIGANIGLYTALTASVVRNRGRLFAFEPNPRSFAALQRTVVANRLHDHPNVVAANLLVSDRCGRGTLYYTAELPVGGTMSDIPLIGGERHSVELEMTTIDAFLPPDLAVDLVKIDVEGHEPLVLRGMEGTIARSPNIRFIIEFAEGMLAHTMKAADFAEYIRTLGFGICRLFPKLQARLVPPGEPITGFNYCLLTRTPERDIATIERRRRAAPIRFKRWWSRHAPRWGRYRRRWHSW